MSAEQHRHQADKGPLEVAILVVSSTRTESTDRSGQRIAEMLAEAGHQVRSRAVVDDDVAAIRAAVRALASADVPVVLLTGGTGLSGRDVTPEALAPLLSPVLDGFGELFRWLSFQEIGPAAMLSRATAGLCDRTVVFALPGSVSACELALSRLVLPELGHLVHLARKERAAPTLAAAEPAVDGPVDVAFEPVSEPVHPPPSPGAAGGGAMLTLGAIPAPSAPPVVEDTDAGWLRTVKRWGAEVLRGVREPIPEEIERLAPVLDVLQRAGDFGALVMPDGRRFALYGYPDLLRPSSKVLAVAGTGGIPHVLALHRWPAETGTCIDGDASLTPDRGQRTEVVAERLTSRAPSGEPGPLFAVSGEAVWFERGRKIARWDGRKETDQGTPNQALATLVLEWSQR